jgi:uncharacterized membrane protein (UPF0182 family)
MKSIRLSQLEANASTQPPPIAAASTKQDWPTLKAALQQYGEQFHTARQMYDALRKQFGPPKPLSAAAIPDWSGVHARGVSILRYDPDQPTAASESKISTMPTAKLTPAARKKYLKQMQDVAHGKMIDSLLSTAIRSVSGTATG